jgi:hypothetical protein
VRGYQQLETPVTVVENQLIAKYAVNDCFFAFASQKSPIVAVDTADV